MEQEKEATLYLNKQTDLLTVEYTCPICREKHFHGTPYVYIPCNKCGMTHTSEFKQTMFTKVSGKLETKKAHNNKITIIADEEYEQDIVYIHYLHKQYKNWEVGELEESTQEYKFCKLCGVCLSCYHCECGTHFKKDTNKRRQRCPECKSEKFKKTYFTEAASSKKTPQLHVCPYCHSEEINMTRTTHKTKCHACGSDKLSEPRIKTLFTLIIKRKKGYEL